MSNYAVIANATNICDNVVVWDDNLGPWTPPADHYAVDIDGLEVGIGCYYDPATQVWTAPPWVMASFSPSPIFLTQTTVLTWSAANATSVTIDGEAVAVSGTKDYTPSVAGKITVKIVATGLAGTTTTTASVTVVATQEELATAGNPSVI
jgi:hypothetical protein